MYVCDVIIAIIEECIHSGKTFAQPRRTLQSSIKYIYAWSINYGLNRCRHARQCNGCGNHFSGRKTWDIAATKTLKFLHAGQPWKWRNWSKDVSISQCKLRTPLLSSAKKKIWDWDIWSSINAAKVTTTAWKIPRYLQKKEKIGRAHPIRQDVELSALASVQMSSLCLSNLL